MIEQLRARNGQKSQSSREVVVFKAQYGPRLQILKECSKLYESLRQCYDRSFLENVRTVVAHPVSTNMFLRSHSFNFVPGITGPKKREKGG